MFRGAMGDGVGGRGHFGGVSAGGVGAPESAGGVGAPESAGGVAGVPESAGGVAGAPVSAGGGVPAASGAAGSPLQPKRVNTPRTRADARVRFIRWFLIPGTEGSRAGRPHAGAGPRRMMVISLGQSLCQSDCPLSGKNSEF